MKVVRLCMCLQRKGPSVQTCEDLTYQRIEKKSCVLEVFGDESWVRDLSWYAGNHQCPGYLQHIMQPS